MRGISIGTTFDPADSTRAHRSVLAQAYAAVRARLDSLTVGDRRSFDLFQAAAGFADPEVLRRGDPAVRPESRSLGTCRSRSWRSLMSHHHPFRCAVRYGAAWMRLARDGCRSGRAAN